MPDFEVLDAKIASALNRIIHNSHFKRRVSLEEQKAQKEDRFLRGRQIACFFYDYFRVTGANDSVENMLTYSLSVYEMMIFRNSIPSGTEFVLSMTKIPSDVILEGLYKLRIRQSEKLKTVLELYDLETHQKKARPDYHSIHRTRIISISNDSRQDHGYHLQTAGLRWTSSRCSISLYPGKNGRCSQITENIQIGMSRHLESSTTTQMA